MNFANAQIAHIAQFTQTSKKKLALSSVPNTDIELLQRARHFAGYTLAELGDVLGIPVPESPKRAKGKAGTLLEKALGATAGSRAAPDFEHLGIELKTIPLNRRGKPQESTFVCAMALRAMADTEWETSLVRRKLHRVLFVPIESDRALSLRQRRIGTAFFWTPTQAQKDTLQHDWEMLAALVARGEIEHITARLGHVLQVRPKAANASVRRLAVGVEGQQWSLPRGFYLRARFTATIVANVNFT